MDWTERLNRTCRSVSLAPARAEIIMWAYGRHLPDNVPHRHTFFEVCQVGRHGHGLFIVEGREHVIGPGDVFYARPGVVHQIVNTAQPLMELSWVSYGLSSESDPAGETGRLLRAFAASDVLVQADSDGHIAAVWHALRLTAAGDRRTGYEGQIAGVATALLLALAALGAGAITPPPQSQAERYDANAALARLAVRYIHDNLNRRLSVSEVASHVHVSPRHLSRIFAHFTGASPAAYIEYARMDRAGALLCHSATPIKEISAEVGYPDVHHFSRVFARRFNCPPGEFRQRGGTAPVPNIQRPGALI